jgi:tRNA(Ile2) C34 agmatinyltransferase TiaS
MSCNHCGGRLMYDGLELEWRCLLCSRPRRTSLRRPSENPSGRPAFRRNWDVAPEELRLDCGA